MIILLLISYILLTNSVKIALSMSPYLYYAYIWLIKVKRHLILLLLSIIKEIYIYDPNYEQRTSK